MLGGERVWLTWITMAFPICLLPPEAFIPTARTSIGGNSAELKVELHKVGLLPNDVLLLCSDGLTGMVPEVEVARILREQLKYRGELRATGQVLRDQFLFMQRAGFNAFEVRKEADATAFAETLKRYSVFYQPTGDGRITVFRQRMARMNDNSEQMKGAAAS